MKKSMFVLALIATILLHAGGRTSHVYINVVYQSKNNLSVNTLAFEKIFLDELQEISFVLDKTLAQTTITLDIACITVDQMELGGRKYNVFTAKIGARLLIANSKQEILYIETIEPVVDSGSNPVNAELTALNKLRAALLTLVRRDKDTILGILLSKPVN